MSSPRHVPRRIAGHEAVRRAGIGRARRVREHLSRWTAFGRRVLLAGREEREARRALPVTGRALPAPRRAALAAEPSNHSSERQEWFASTRFRFRRHLLRRRRRCCRCSLFGLLFLRRCKRGPSVARLLPCKQAAPCGGYACRSRVDSCLPPMVERAQHPHLEAKARVAYSPCVRIQASGQHECRARQLLGTHCHLLRTRRLHRARAAVTISFPGRDKR